MNFLFKFALNLLDKLGRKKVLVDFAGNQIVHRYYLFYHEDDQDTRWIAKLPNIYIHHNLVEYPDGPDLHCHPWNTWSFILNGGYIEEFENDKKKYNPRWSFFGRSRDTFHRIAKADPNTWTVFMHGWRKRDWSFKSHPCKIVCSTCSEKYNGECYNAKNEAPYEAYFDTKGGAWKATVWFRTTLPGLWEKIARRQRAVQKVKVKPLDEVKSEIICEKLASNSDYGQESIGRKK
jgi:hypothetical protein